MTDYPKNIEADSAMGALYARQIARMQSEIDVLRKLAAGVHVGTHCSEERRISGARQAKESKL